MQSAADGWTGNRTVCDARPCDQTAGGAEAGRDVKQLTYSHEVRIADVVGAHEGPEGDTEAAGYLTETVARAHFVTIPAVADAQVFSETRNHQTLADPNIVWVGKVVHLNQSRGTYAIHGCNPGQRIICLHDVGAYRGRISSSGHRE